MSQIIILLFINFLGALGYSLIAPLYPQIASEIGLTEDIIGVIISVFAFSSVCIIPFTLPLLKIFGRKRVLIYSIILETILIFVYGLLNFIKNKTIFILISCLLRFFQGIATSITLTIVYSFAASICDNSELKRILGYLELIWCLGVSVGPLVGAFFYWLGGYTLPFIFIGTMMAFTVYFVKDIEITEFFEQKEISFFTSVSNMDIISIIVSIIFDMICRTFYFPTLTKYLINEFNFTLESSSVFFIVSMTSYFFMIQIIQYVTDRLGLRLTILMGILINSFGLLLIPPIPILPKNPLVIILGMIILGIPAAFIYIPAVCLMIEIYKEKFRYNENNSHDISSALFNLGICMGEVIGPSLGGYISAKSKFENSCYFISILNLVFAVIFIYIWKFNIRTGNNDKSLLKSDFEIIKRYEIGTEYFSYSTRGSNVSFIQ